MIFYTENLPNGVIAEFVETLQAPWGDHDVRGVIIHSTRDDCATVLWYKCGKYFPSTPKRHNVEHAAQWILDAFAAWRGGGR